MFKEKITNILYLITIRNFIFLFPNKKHMLIRKNLVNFHPDSNVSDKSKQIEIIYYNALSIILIICGIIGYILYFLLNNGLGHLYISSMLNCILGILIFPVLFLYVYLALRTIPLILAANSECKEMKKIYAIYDIEYVAVFTVGIIFNFIF